jgi:phosphoribosylformylglycinamidine cyclo-ligase
VPRVLPEGAAVEIDRGSWPVPPVFEVMRELGNVAEAEMHRTFNMGVGMVVICADADAPAVKSHLKQLDEPCYEIGRVVNGDRTVELK